MVSVCEMVIVVNIEVRMLMIIVIVKFFSGLVLKVYSVMLVSMLVRLVFRIVFEVFL